MTTIVENQKTQATHTTAGAEAPATKRRGVVGRILGNKMLGHVLLILAPVTLLGLAFVGSLINVESEAVSIASIIAFPVVVVALIVDAVAKLISKSKS